MGKADALKNAKFRVYLLGGRRISNRISLKVLSTFKDTCRRAWNVCGYFRKTLNSLVRYILVNQVGLGDLRCRKVEKSRETSLILSGTWLSGRGWVRYPRHSIKREERDTPAIILCLLPSLARHLFLTYILWGKLQNLLTGLEKKLPLIETKLFDLNISMGLSGNLPIHLVLLEDLSILATMIMQLIV